MVANISERLASLVRRVPDRTRVQIQVVLRRGIDPRKSDSSAALRRLLGEAKYIPISGTMHGTVPLKSVTAIAESPLVEWVDLEGQASVEELIDQR